MIRSFSKILSLLVGPTNVAIDNWTFQMFYKVPLRRRNMLTMMIWLAIALTMDNGGTCVTLELVNYR